jgi:DNA primase
VAGRIRQEDIEAVRERTDIAKVVQNYLTLRKAGHDSLVGLCPFHTEKTASFSVSPSKGVYYCFGCGAGGDAIRFLTQVENLSFKEAVERLARDAGVTLRYEGESPGERRAASRRAAMHQANADAADAYHRILMDAPEAAEARRYLASRGIDREAAERFEVGFAPSEASFLLRRLARKASPELLLEAGLASKDPAGGVRDRFRGRITFPIHDLSGHAVGFGARMLGEGDGPKYLNSPETPVYRKGETLYNLHRAKPALTRSGEAFVVEGYTDVIALHQAGTETAVATCGTALGEAHFRVLSRFARRVILAFDSDEAGARAAERAYGFHQDHPVEVRVLILPDGLDPADFVQKRGSESLLELAESAQPLVQYMLDRTIRRFDLSTVEGQAMAVEACLPLVEGLRDDVSREQYAHHVADRTGVSENSVLLKLQRRTTHVDAGRPAAEQGARRQTPQQRVEWEVLKLLAQRPETLADAEIPEDHFERAQHRRILALLRSGNGDLRSLVGESEDDRLTGQLAALATEPLDGEPTAEYAERVRLRLEEFALKRRIDSMRKDLERLNPMKDPDYEPKFVELSKLEGARRRVREQAERL